MRIINILGVITFLIFAWLQLDDDNPEIYTEPSMLDVWSWVIFYGMIALAYLAACFRKYPKWLYVASIIFAIYFIAVSAPGLIDNLTSGSFEMTKGAMNPENPQVETTREFLGALIALLATLFLFWQSCKCVKTERQLPSWVK